MINDNEMKLFKKTDTTLVYTASTQFAKGIMVDNYHNVQLYIHVTRDTGFVIIYEDNDINKVVSIDLNEQEYILKRAEDDR